MTPFIKVKVIQQLIDQFCKIKNEFKGQSLFRRPFSTSLNFGARGRRNNTIVLCFFNTLNRGIK